ncbi:MAG TPA: toxin-antitoxin system HicB family antitoxin [Thermoanaerobaculia bacterium]|nr:toxin-antitoxin system HicB family antitoxin [Thermoanaerobaculia bacterium]
MSTLSLRLPQSLHRKLGEVAEREGISINQLINSAVAEKMSALMTEEYLQARAARGTRRKFAAALGKVADVEPRIGCSRGIRGRPGGRRERPDREYRGELPWDASLPMRKQRRLRH